MDATKLSIPITALAGISVGLWFIFNLLANIDDSLIDVGDGLKNLQTTHAKFEHEVRITAAMNKLRLLDRVATKTAEQVRDYDLLVLEVKRNTEKRDELE